MPLLNAKSVASFWLVLPCPFKTPLTQFALYFCCRIQVIFVCVVFTSPLMLYLGTKVYDTYPSGVGKSYPHFLYSYLGVGSEGGNRDEKKGRED